MPPNKQKLYHPSVDSNLRPQSVVMSKGAAGFTKAACRKMAMYDSRKPGANFKCPECRCWFYLYYGKFGTMGKFLEQPTFHCRDCAESSKFTKV